MIRFALNMLISIMKSLDHISVLTAMPLLNQDKRTQQMLTYCRCSPEKGFFFFSQPKGYEKNEIIATMTTRTKLASEG